MALTRSPKRPRQFLLHMLFWQEFEDLVRALGFAPIRGGLDPRSNRAETVAGMRALKASPTSWPSEKDQEDGKYVLQSKHTGNAGGCCSDSDFKTHMTKEVKKVKTLITDKELSHYLVFTNPDHVRRRR